MLLLTGIGSSAAVAEDFSIGLGAGVDRGRVDCVAGFACERSSSDVKLTGTYRALDAVDVQAVYFDAGHFKGGDTTPLGTAFGGTFKVSGLGLTAGTHWDIAPGWRFAVSAGAASVRTRFTYENMVWGSASKTTLQPFAGISVGYAVTPALRIGVDYDVTRFRVHTTRGPLQMLGLAAQYSF